MPWHTSGEGDGDCGDGYTDDKQRGMQGIHSLKQSKKYIHIFSQNIMIPLRYAYLSGLE